MATSAVEQAPPDDASAHAKTGVWSWVTTVDHKRIGIMYGVSAFVFFLIGGLEALLLRWQLGSADNTFLSPDAYNQLFTMHGTTMIFLGVMPLSAMFFNYLIPLQIGARDVVFPRLNAFSFWVFLIGGLLLNASFLFGAAPNAGWFGYANLTETQYSPGVNTDFWIAGLQSKDDHKPQHQHQDEQTPLLPTGKEIPGLGTSLEVQHGNGPGARWTGTVQW